MRRSALLLLLGVFACGGSTEPRTRQLSVTLLGAGAGMVTSSTSGDFACSRANNSTTGTCSVNVDVGTTPTLSAKPASGSVFVGWGGGAGCETGQPVMDGDKVCIATFAPESYRRILLTAVSAGFNTDTASCGYSDLASDNVAFFHGHGCETRSGRGFNVAIIDPATGSMLRPVHSYDTWGDVYWYFSYPAITDSLKTALSTVPAGALIMIAVGDDAGINESDVCTNLSGKETLAVLALLKSLGSAQIGKYCFRDSWAMIALSTGNGTGQVISEAVGKATKVTAQTTIAVP